MPTVPPEHPTNGAETPAPPSHPLDPGSGRPVPAASAERAAAPALETPWLDAVASGGRGRNGGSAG